MKFRPDDAELLDAIAQLLEEEVLPTAPGPVQHKVRVAANLTRILQRQAGMEADAQERERTSLAQLLYPGRPESANGGLDGLRAELDARLWAGAELTPEIWASLVATARDDLAVSKPGHDAWEGL